MINYFIIACVSLSNIAAAQTVTFDIMQSHGISLEVFKCYITAVELVDETGAVYREKDSYHLLTIEEKGSMSFPLHSTLTSPVKLIRFTIGTDSLTNVSGVMEGDLDPIKGMYWAWNSGYINFKLEGDFVGKAFEYHIGGYLPPYPTVRTIELPVYHSQEIRISIHPQQFLEKVNVTEHPSVLVPGEKAAQLADIFQTIFSTNE